MDENRRTLSDWLQFFLEAGIPASQAANYAVSFVENRIEKSMLAELDKDYLKELGVTVLGDVITILKHSKRVAAQTAKKAEAEIIGTEDDVKKSSSASRLLDRLFKGDNSSKQSSKAMVIDDEEEVLVKASSRVSTVSRPKKSKLRSERMAQSTSSPAPRRKVAPPPTNKPLLSEEVPVPKKRRVLPEHEGGYKITMPAGTIPKTAKLKAQGKLVKKSADPSANQGVFSRLGSAQSNDAGDGQESPLMQTVISKAKSGHKNKNISFTVTGLGKIDPQNINLTKESSVEEGVFVRLGKGTPSTRRTIKRPATSTQRDEPIVLGSAPYVGVLKDGAKRTPLQTRIKLAPSPANKSGFGASRLATDNVKQRLGRGQSEGGAGVSRIIRTSTAPAGSIRRRLGGSGDSTVSSSTDRSQSAIRVATKYGVRKDKELVSRKPVKTASVGSRGSQDVFSRLGSR